MTFKCSGQAEPFALLTISFCSCVAFMTTMAPAATGGNKRADRIVITSNPSSMKLMENIIRNAIHRYINFNIFDLNSFSQYFLFYRFIKKKSNAWKRRISRSTPKPMWPRLIRWRRSKFVEMLIRIIIQRLFHIRDSCNPSSSFGSWAYGSALIWFT